MFVLLMVSGTNLKEGSARVQRFVELWYRMNLKIDILLPVWPNPILNLDPNVSQLKSVGEVMKSISSRKLRFRYFSQHACAKGDYANTISMYAPDHSARTVRNTASGHF